MPFLPADKTREVYNRLVTICDEAGNSEMASGYLEAMLNFHVITKEAWLALDEAFGDGDFDKAKKLMGVPEFK